MKENIWPARLKIFTTLTCISFLLLLWQMTTNLVPWNNTHVLPHSFRGQKFELGLTRWKVRPAVLLLEAVGENRFLCFVQLPEAPAFLSSQPLPPASKPAMAGGVFITLPSDTTSPAALFPLEGPLWLQGAHLENTGSSPHLKILTLIHLQSPFCSEKKHIHRFQGLGYRHWRPLFCWPQTLYRNSLDKEAV